MRHNKKRNVGLLYEFLTRSAAEGVVDGDEKRVRQAVKLIKKHFKEGTELHREFRLFRALIGATVDTRHTAQRIIETSRRAAQSYDQQRLDREKSLLIRGINHTFKDDSFYDKRVDEYKLYATVQTLLNEWRQDVPTDIASVARYEEDLVEHLVTPKKQNVLDEGKRDQVDDLVVKLMMKKVDGKYQGLLSNEQLALLNSYVYSMRSGDMTQVTEAIEKLRRDVLTAIDAYAAEASDDPNVPVEKLSEVRQLVKEPPQQINDDTLAHYLRIAKLKAEILGD